MFWNSTIGKLLMTLLISMTPVLELRGAIPAAVASGLDLRTSVLVAVIGNLIPVPFVILFISRIFAWMRKMSYKLDLLVTRLEKRAYDKAELVQRYTFWGLALFVAIPLPGTGAWTGALIAGVIHMDAKQAFLSIALGVIAAGLIVASLTYGVGTLINGGMVK